MIMLVARDPPPRFEIQIEDGEELCTVRFYQDLKHIDSWNWKSRYTAEVIEIKIRYEEGLERAIENNYYDWLQFALESNNQKGKP